MKNLYLYTISKVREGASCLTLKKWTNEHAPQGLSLVRISAH